MLGVVFLLWDFLSGFFDLLWNFLSEFFVILCDFFPLSTLIFWGFSDNVGILLLLNLVLIVVFCVFCGLCGKVGCLFNDFDGVVLVPPIGFFNLFD